MPRIARERLEDICRKIVLAMGASPAAADDVVVALLSANMEGVDSHGVMRLPIYYEYMEQGLINPRAEPTVQRQDRAVTVLDGHWCFGQVGARVAARQAIASAREHGLGAAGLYHVLHVGRMKDFVEMVAAENMVALVFCSAGPAGGTVAPYRGARGRFGTNPLAFAVPRAGKEPLVGDFATSVSAEGKVRLAANLGKPVPPGTIQNAAGSPTTNAADFYAGGSLLPMAAHKGYCLALFVEIVGGLLVGARGAALSTTMPGNGFFIVAIDISTMTPVDAFMTGLEELAAVVKATPPAPGQGPVLLPGEPETLARVERERLGIPVDDAVWASLAELGARLGLPEALFAQVAAR